MSKRLDRANSLMSGLRQRRNTLAAEIKTINDNIMYSDAHKDVQRANARRLYGDSTKAEGKAAWESLKGIIKEAKTERAKLLVGKDWDVAKVNAISQQIAVRLGPVASSGPLGQGLLEKIAQIHEAYATLNDKDALFALRQVAGPIMDRVPPVRDSQQYQIVTALRRRFADDERADMPELANMEDLEREIRELDRMPNRLKIEVLECEKMASDTPYRDVGSVGASMWTREIFEEQPAAPVIVTPPVAPETPMRPTVEDDADRIARIYSLSDRRTAS